MQTFSSTEVRSHNASLILQLLWREKSLSRAELSRRTGLSRSTVSAICEELAERQLTRELGPGPSSGGKPPQLIGFREDAYHLVGIDLGASHTTVLLADLRGNILASHSLPADSRDKPYEAIEKANECLEHCMAAVEFDWKRVVGVGVGVPCPVNPDEPEKLSVRVLPAWQGIDYLSLLKIPEEVPTWVDNDANLGGLSELWWGNDEPPKSLVFIKASVGVGAGLIIDGEVYRGANAWAGELGHVVIDPSGPMCACGRAGCLVAFIGQTGLLAQYERTSKHDGTSPATTHELVELANGGDTAAREVLEGAGAYLGAAVTNLLHVLNPNQVIIGGALALAGEHLLCGIRAALADQARWTSELDYEVRTSALGESATALGAATQALSIALRQPELFTVRRTISARSSRSDP
jgi:predicted NBD/HSP70 family sugar kinase